MQRPFVSFVAVVSALIAALVFSSAHTPAAGQNQAAGRPFVDCVAQPVRIQQLRSGLPTMDEAIRRTDAQLTAARQASLNADAAARERALGAAKAELQSAITDFVGEAITLRRQVEALRQAGLSPGARRELLEQAKDAQEVLTQLQNMESYWTNAQKLMAVGQAGFQTGVELRTAARSFSQDLARVNDLFVKTGIWETLGSNLASSFGPLGSLAFRASRVAMDVGFSIVEGALSEAEYLQAQQNLDAMRYQRSRVEARVFDMEALMKDNCTTPTQVASSPTPVPPSPPATPQPVAPPQQPQQPQPPQQTQQKSGGGAGKALAWLGVAGGGAAGYSLYCRQNPQEKVCFGSGGGSCSQSEGSQLAQAMNDACFRGIGSCSATRAAYTNWCEIDCGLTFNSSTGSCR